TAHSRLPSFPTRRSSDLPVRFDVAQAPFRNHSDTENMAAYAVRINIPLLFWPIPPRSSTCTLDTHQAEDIAVDSLVVAPGVLESSDAHTPELQSRVDLVC